MFAYLGVNNKMDLPETESNVKRTVINCLEAPHLPFVLTKHVIELKKLRCLYEKQIEKI